MSVRQLIVQPLPLLVAMLVACTDNSPTTTTPVNNTFANNPCSQTGTLSLTVATATRIDCGNGGTTLTLEGNGASYLVMPQFATNSVANQSVGYTLATGNLEAASLSASRAAAFHSAAFRTAAAMSASLPALRPMRQQADFERRIFSRARGASAGGAGMRQASMMVPPTLGSIRSFKVLSSFTANTWTNINASLAYLGANVYLYIDTNAPANGFTPAQLTAFGLLFDQTLYTIDTTAFGLPSDLDGNNHVIMLMSPKVNGDTPASTCNTLGYTAGFFDPEDFDGPSNPNSNQGEVFYSIVPDPNGTASCSHSVAEVGQSVPATFLHELQHLINYSQHVVVHGGSPLASGLDEGMSIVAEELGSKYYEDKCPPPSCRTSPTQIFPDSAQGYLSGWLDNSYLYALLPDSASVTLHTDDQDGFSWRGGDWLLSRYLGDQYGTEVFHELERGPSDGIAAISSASGQSFATLFANFGLALYTDSFPGMARATAPAANRFVSRNLRQLWARVYATEGPSTQIPLAMPLVLEPITTSTTVYGMSPGTMSYWRLDTPATAATVTIRFSGPNGTPFTSALHSQIGIFRLPPGQ